MHADKSKKNRLKKNKEIVTKAFTALKTCSNLEIKLTQKIIV